MDYGEFLDVVKDRGPDWRYRAAKGEIAIKIKKDKYVEQFKKYLKGGKDKACELAEFFYTNEWFRIKIEVYILAKYTNQEIADLFTVNTPAIELYKKVFYDVPENAGHLVRLYLAQQEEDETGKNWKISAVNLGKDFIAYWLANSGGPIENIQAEFKKIKKGLLSKIRSIDKISFGTAGYRDMLKTIELLFKDVKEDQELAGKEKYFDLLTSIITTPKKKHKTIKEIEKENKKNE